LRALRSASLASWSLSAGRVDALAERQGVQELGRNGSFWRLTVAMPNGENGTR
jgi:hypothetical protein